MSDIEIQEMFRFFYYGTKSKLSVAQVNKSYIVAKAAVISSIGEKKTQNLIKMHALKLVIEKKTQDMKEKNINKLLLNNEKMNKKIQDIKDDQVYYADQIKEIDEQLKSKSFYIYCEFSDQLTHELPPQPIDEYSSRPPTYEYSSPAPPTYEYSTRF